ncbi:MAG: SUMF1/EgtB/PvdO family nonheme iron enzyme [Planctomycetes bacterium]|nr:SUMF1/EgtB/PvdO family nonheme iron enzyme [Planctomycetota bacterium]
MGVVLEVRDRSVDRRLAMKRVATPRAEADPIATWSTLAGLLIDEADTTAKLEHPGIVPVHELGIDREGRPFFTMRRVHGDTLAAHLATPRGAAGAWSTARFVEVLVRVCDALAFAHDRGVVHRDVKPLNVMVGPFGEVYLMDWGLAIDLRQARDAARQSTVGTPSYMAPEQAGAGPEAVSPRSDVYAVGAMLYEWLTGHPQYADSPTTRSSRAILRALRSRPPTPPGALARRAPAELVAICERAMSRDPAARYADAKELSDDLRRFVDGRVVLAHRTGALPELAKWIRRNRMAAASLGAALLLGVLALLALGRALRLTERQALLGEGSRLDQLEDELRACIPPWPEHRAALRDLRGRIARDAGGARDRIRGTLGPAAASGDGDEVGGRLRTLLGRLDAALDAPGGLLARTDGLAARSDRLAAADASASARWVDARALLAADARFGARFGGLPPQSGLVPLGPNPHGLLEFHHVESAAPGTPGPHRGPDGELVTDADCGIVFVLLPGGIAALGSPAEAAPGAVRPDEEEPRTVALDAFFVARCEVTQAQWLRLAGDANPSAYPAGEPGVGWGHPVESVSAVDCEAALQPFGLELPTEAQWELACRAGTTTAWSTGDDPASLAGSANLRDRSSWVSTNLPAATPFDDGYPVHAPVGSFRPNAFGLCDLHGNVAEWCRDVWDRRREHLRTGDGLALGGAPPSTDRHDRVIRGGAFDSPPANARSARRLRTPATNRLPTVGLRPTRPVIW